MKRPTVLCWLWIVMAVAIAAAWWMDRQKLNAALDDARRAATTERP